jgi:hypothetical protein
MRTISFCLIVLMAATAFAQAPMRGRPVGPYANTAEMAVKQAMEALGERRKAVERDTEVLRRLRSADVALTDPMQPENAVQKAYEEVDKAKSLMPEPSVMQGIIKVQRELEGARRSPASADFGRLRAILHEQALVPASRVAARDSLRMEEETVAWLRVQELISAHVRALAEIAGDSLRATQDEK